MTAQPVWKFVMNLGDATPLDHGGLFLYEDKTGTYGFEMERIEPLENGKLEVRRVRLDRCVMVKGEARGYLVTAYIAGEYPKGTLPHPLPSYEEWFTKDLDAVADTMDTTVEEIRTLLCSERGEDRAEAYRMIFDHHGWDNGDSYPRTITKKEARARYMLGELERT